MRFNVPQFIEEESKIILFLNFKQVVFIGASVALCVVFWFTIESTFIFSVLAFITLSIGTSLALLKINKTPLPIFIKNYFVYLLKPKIYLWQKSEKKEASKEFKKEVFKEEKKKPSVPLTRKGRIHNLSAQIDSKK